MGKTIMFTRRSAAVLALALAAAFPVLAAPPDIGEALKQVAPTHVPPREAPPLPELGGAPAEPPLQRLASEKVVVKVFNITGNTAIATDELLALVAPLVGKELTLAELEEAASTITRHYRGKGYFVARVYIPAQEIKDGIVTLRVIEGNYGKFQLQNKSLVDDQIVQGILDDVKDRDIVSTDTVERAMLIINDTPGAAVTRADVLPGEKVGTSDFALATDATARFNGYVLADNHGSLYTGRNRLSFGGDINSPFGRGDKLSVSGMTTNGSWLKNGRLAYSTLLAGNGLRGELAALRTTYQLTDIYASLDAVGRADTVEATFTYPFKRTRLASIEGSVNVASRRMLDEIRSTSTQTPKTARIATAGIKVVADHFLLGLAGTSVALASLSYGHLEINEAGARALDAAGVNTQGNFGKANLNLSRTTQITNRLSLSASLKLQKALMNKNLDGSERMTVSGSSGVKAYPSSEVSGENAYLGNLELLYALPPVEQVRYSVGLFADTGRAAMENQVGATAARRISDFGIGLYANFAGVSARLQIAKRAGGQPATSETVSSPRVLLQLGYAF